MTDIDPMGLLRAENETMRAELNKASRLLKELVGRCKKQDEALDHMAGHLAVVLHKNGGSIVLTPADLAMAKEEIIQGYREEGLEDDRVMLRCVTIEEYEEHKRKREAVDQAREEGGGPNLRIVTP